MTRRNFLTVGLGAGALSLLPASPVSGNPKAVPTMSIKTKNVIIILLTGGMSHIDSLDAKPEALENIRGPFSAVRTKSGQSVFTEPFRELAGVDDRFALLGAMKSDGTGTHDDAYRSWLRLPDKSHLLTMLAKKSQGLPGVNPITPGVYPIFKPEHDAQVRTEDGLVIEMPWSPDKKEYIFSANFQKPERHEERMALRAGLNGGVLTPAMARFEDNHGRADAILRGGLVQALRDEDAPAGKKAAERYGDNPYGTVMRVAGKLADPGGMNAGVVAVETGHWDFHGGLKQRMEGEAAQLSRAVAALIRDYGDRVVICMRGEFGRYAVDTSDTFSGPGRGHHAVHAGLIAGPDIRPIRYGKTEKNGFEIDKDMTTNADFADLLLQASGTISRHTRNSVANALLLSR